MPLKNTISRFITIEIARIAYKSTNKSCLIQTDDDKEIVDTIHTEILIFEGFKGYSI